MSDELENDELYVEHETFGEGVVLSIDEDTDIAEIQFEHGVESIDINDLLEDTNEEDEGQEELEEGRGKKGQARQSSKCCDNEEDEYERKGNKPVKGKFDYARQKKQSQYDESADLVSHALEKKPVDFAAAFNDMLQVRLQDRIESLRIGMAQSIYNPSEDGNDEDA